MYCQWWFHTNRNEHSEFWECRAVRSSRIVVSDSRQGCHHGEPACPDGICRVAVSRHAVRAGSAAPSNKGKYSRLGAGSPDPQPLLSTAVQTAVAHTAARILPRPGSAQRCYFSGPLGIVHSPVCVLSLWQLMQSLLYVVTNALLVPPTRCTRCSSRENGGAFFEPASWQSRHEPGMSSSESSAAGCLPFSARPAGALALLFASRPGSTLPAVHCLRATLRRLVLALGLVEHVTTHAAVRVRIDGSVADHRQQAKRRDEQ